MPVIKISTFLSNIKFFFGNTRSYQNLSYILEIYIWWILATGNMCHSGELRARLDWSLMFYRASIFPSPQNEMVGDIVETAAEYFVHVVGKIDQWPRAGICVKIYLSKVSRDKCCVCYECWDCWNLIASVIVCQSSKAAMNWLSETNY